MGHARGEDLDPSQVQAFVASRFDPRSRQVAHVGAGAWSRCFGFHWGEHELVVRFGRHIGRPTTKTFKTEAGPTEKKRAGRHHDTRHTVESQQSGG
jgi:hypothetical protein